MGRDALRIKGSYSWGFEEKKDAEDLKKEKEKKKQDAKDAKDNKKKDEKKVEEPELEKPLKDFLNLRNLDITIRKGEFVCVIGDVGSGKTSLFSAVIGDMIYLPEKEIEEFGGPDKCANKEGYEKFKKSLLSKECQFEAPVQLDGSLSYVEQNAWI